MFRILVVDDDSTLRSTVSSALSESHYLVDQASDGEEALSRIQAGRYDLVLLDVNMPRMTGLEVLKEIRSFDPSIVVLILTAFSNIRDAVEATKSGAYNYLEKPIQSENLVYLVDRALKARHMAREMRYSAPVVRLANGTEFVGQSSGMKKVFEVIDKLSRVDTPVLIRGESGTGKELVAQALHYNGPRKENRFVSVNCSAIPENLIESEFFGHEKGAFTGADTRHIGKFQYADGGTLFLDEIGDISAGMQVKLLRVLQEKKFTPVGSNREIEVNVRIVAATNRPLEDMIKKGTFREDLFYRLNVLPIQLPPLRERANDIEVLASYFVEKFNDRYKKQIQGPTDEVLAILKTHDWPGNIRELENVLEHSFVIETDEHLHKDSLPNYLATLKPKAFGTASEEEADGESDKEVSIDPSTLDPIGFTLDVTKLDFQANKEEFERQFLISALKAFKGRINQTALHANIPKKTLLRKLEKYGITAKDYSE